MDAEIGTQLYPSAASSTPLRDPYGASRRTRADGDRAQPPYGRLMTTRDSQDFEPAALSVADGPVIVGTDGTEAGADAETLGRLLARLLDAPLEVVNVADPDRALPEAAVAEHAAVIVLGHTHRRHLARVLAGTARRVLQSAPCPIAITPPAYADRAETVLRRIGVGYEPTPEGVAALATAHELAARAGGELRAVGVALPVAPFAIDDARDQTPYLDEERRAVRAGLEYAVGDLPGVVPTVLDARIGSPGGELVDVSDDLDLLVCGSRRRSPLHVLLLGSVTERLLEDAACPLLIVPCPVAAR